MWGINLSAQTTSCKVVGKILDDNGEPVVMATIKVKHSAITTRSRADGSFELDIPCEGTILVVVHTSFKNYELIIPDNTPVYNARITLTDLDVELDTHEVKEERQFGFQAVPKIEPRLFPGMGNVEDYIKSAGLGVRSNNEMSSTYSVRGGNYEENLIYVNAIEIYRPFLVRAGQQEGLSFINPDLVEDINFSSGGFEARYDDKLSSVLDIRYRTPSEFKGTVSGSLLGGGLHLEGVSKNKRFTWLMGARYQANAYLLGSLDTKGDYKPKFGDFQTLLTYAVTDELSISMLSYFSSNNYHFVPQTRETEFGTINQALKLTIFYEGQEVNLFRTYANAVTLDYEPNKKWNIKWINSFFFMRESESYDVLGQYRLGELEKDLGSENFGEVAFQRGIGGFLEHARNRLDSKIMNSKVLAVRRFKTAVLSIGAKYQHQEFDDTFSEWKFLDSAGYSTPQLPADEIVLSSSVKSKANISSNVYTGHVQTKWRWNFTDTITKFDSVFTSKRSLELCVGARANYLDLNQNLVFSPRVSLNYIPSWFYRKGDIVKRRNILFRLATGFYYQPPLYREMRDMNGVLNTSLKDQRSIHFIAGTDVFFTMWGRTFKYTAEAYYKILSDIVPYEVDNVRLRYYANNDAKGYVYGADMKIHGQFIKGIESWATLSFLNAKEDITNDEYYDYYNSDGEIIYPGYTVNNIAVDSVKHTPGYIPRPTDQRVSFGLYFQDEMPKLPQFKVHMNLLFGTGLPYGPPDFNRYKDTLRTPMYRRVDIGFSYQLFYNKEKLRERSFGKKIDGAWLSLEVFNLLGISNTINYSWIEDVTGRVYAVPNYLTARRLNLKFLVKF